LPSDPVARVLRTTWLAALAGCVVVKYGAPTAVSALALALAVVAVPLLASFAAGRDATERRRLLTRTSLAGLGAALAAAGLAAVQESVRPLQTPWLTLFGIPFAFAAAGFDGPLVPASRGAALLWTASLAAGVAASEAWLSSAGTLLLALAAASGVADAAFSTARAARLKGVVPPPSAGKRALLAALIVALASVASAAAARELLQRVPRLLSSPAPPRPAAEDRLARQAAPPPPVDPEKTIALVRAAEGGPDSGALPQPLYLRQSLLDEAHELDGFVWLAPGDGDARTLEDGDDGATDRRVAWPDADRRATKGETIETQITLLERPPLRDAADAARSNVRELLVVSGTLWLEGDTLQLAADGSLRAAPASGGGLSYKDAAAPARAHGRVDPPSRALEGGGPEAERLLSLPSDFDGRALALDLANQAGAGARDDFERADRIAAWFREHGLIDLSHPLERWFDFFAAPAPRGRADHFAQACAIADRLAGLPARVVSGYRTADFDASHRRWRVRAADRHFWVEVAFADGVWIEFDPAPERLAPRATNGDRVAEEFGQRLSEATSLESVQHSMEESRPWWIGIVLLVAVAAFLAFPTLRLAVDPARRGRPPDGLRGPARRAWRYWQELEELCGRFELTASPTQTATEFATRVNVAVPDEAGALARLLAVYHSCRFGGADLAADDERHAKSLLARLPVALQRRRETAPRRARR